MTDYVARMYEEYDQLNQRIEKLSAFISEDSFQKLPDFEQADLREQLQHMRKYFSVLSRRVSRTCGSA